MKLDFPATQRNKDVIADVLADYLPMHGRVLEVASGSGQHICHFAQKFSHLQWLPSDPEQEHQLSIDSWVKDLNLSNVSKALNLNAQKPWEIDNIEFIICINMTHISSFEASIGLFENAKKKLAKGKYLFLYGPYFIEGIETSESNLKFDASLKSRNEKWGIRRFLPDFTGFFFYLFSKLLNIFR